MDSILNKLEKILEERKSASSDQSYVSSLYSKGTSSILEKISEIIHEVADLWFHLLVLLRHEDIEIQEIESELAKRFGVSGHDEKASRE